MKRLELFEFEDFHWLPTTIRSGLTNLIKELHRLMGTSDILSNLLLEIYKKLKFEQIVDMGSGSGGPMIEVIEILNHEMPDNPIKLILSDFYPSPAIVDSINNRMQTMIHYHEQPIDARNMGSTPPGLKTMIASFHHMSPEVAQKILESAEISKEPILIYEIAKNNIPVVVWWLLLPVSLFILIIMSLLLTPFVRPLTWQQLLFTYVIPIIPIIYAWDGQASLMRTYTSEDIESMLASTPNNPDYSWKIEVAKKANGKKVGYYILGSPN